MLKVSFSNAVRVRIDFAATFRRAPRTEHGLTFDFPNVLKHMFQLFPVQLPVVRFDFKLSLHAAAT
jgi:hypothetical protein